MSDSERERPDVLGGPDPTDGGSDLLGGEEPDEEATDVLGGPEPEPAGADLMGGEEPDEEDTDILGGPQAGSDVMRGPGESR